MQLEIKITLDTGCFPPKVAAEMPLGDKAACVLMLAKAAEGLAGEMAKDALQLSLQLSGGNKVKTKGVN